MRALLPNTAARALGRFVSGLVLGVGLLALAGCPTYNVDGGGEARGAALRNFDKPYVQNAHTENAENVLFYGPEDNASTAGSSTEIEAFEALPEPPIR